MIPGTRGRGALAGLPALALATAAAAVLAGCAPADSTAPSSGASVAASASASGDSCAKENLALLTAGTLTIGTDKPAFPPWFVDDDPTNGQGFESAVAYAVVNRMGFTKDEVEWTVAGFNSVIQPGPKTFDFDINQVSITDERRAAVDFSTGYYDVTQAIVAIDGSPAATATSIADLKGVRLGAAVGTTSLAAIENQIKPDQAAAVFDDNDKAKLALGNGQIDALVVDLPTGLFLVAVELDGGKLVGQLPNIGGEPEQFGLVLEKGSALTRCVSAAVDAMRADGTLRTIEQQWLTAEAGAPVLT